MLFHLIRLTPHDITEVQVIGTLLGVPCSAPTASVKITLSPAPVPGLTSNVGGASTSITVCSDETLNFTATGGQSFIFLL